MTITRSVTKRLSGGGQRITWLSAPAGSGKTVLAQALAARFAGSTVWLQLEPEHGQIGRFMTGLVAAFAADLPSATLPPLAAEDIVFAEAYLGRLCRAVLAGHERLLLVLDDLHVLGEDSQPSAALAAAVRKLPDRFSVLLASRLPPDAAWARFRATGEDELVTTAELCLDVAEAAGLIEALGQRAAWQPAALVEASGGWILGARLLLQAGPAGAVALPGSADRAGHAALLDLIAHELLRPLPRADLELLLLLGHLPDLPLGVVASAVAISEAEPRLEGLARHLLFIDLDASGRLHLHDLLKETLTRRFVGRVAQTAIQAVQRRAAAALIATGAPEAGLALLLAAGAFEELTRAVLEQAPALAEAGDFGVLSTVLSAMPEAEREREVALDYWYGVSLLNLDPGAARQLLGAALERARALGREALVIPIWAALVDAIWFEWVDCTLFDPLIQALPELEALALRLGQPEQTAQLARGAFAALSFRRPQNPSFPRWEARNLELFWQPAPRHETVRRGLQLLFRYCWGDGERWKAGQVRERLTYLFDAASAPPADACVRQVAATEYFSIFEPDAEVVIATVQEGLAATAAHGLPFWDVPMLNAALYKMMAYERRAEAKTYLAILAERLGPASRPHDVAIFEHFSAYDHWLEDRNEAALLHASTAYRTALASGFSISPVYYGVAMAAILQRLGRLPEAIRHIARARRLASAQRSSILVFISFLRGAALALDRGRAGLALRYLEVALEAGAEKLLYVHPWIRRHELSALLALARRHDIRAGYAAELIRLLDLPVAAEALPPIEIVTLGRLDIRAAGVSTLPPGKLPRVPIGLLLHLVAAGPGGLELVELADRLWPEVGDEAARNRLKSACYRLRRLLRRPSALVIQGGRVALDERLVAVDCWTIEALAKSGDEGATAPRHASATSLHGGPFGQSLASALSLLLYGQHIERLVAGITEAHARALLDSGDWPAALGVAKSALERLGFDEKLYAIATAAAGLSGAAHETAILAAMVETEAT